MTADQLYRCKAFLNYFNVDCSGDVIQLTGGGNSIIMNPNSEWIEFIGYSINSVAEAYATHMNKKIEYSK